MDVPDVLALLLDEPELVARLMVEMEIGHLPVLGVVSLGSQTPQDSSRRSSNM